jgi:hypothetical protein
MKRLIVLTAGVIVVSQLAKFLKIKSVDDLKDTFGDLKDLVGDQLKNFKSFAMN